MRLLAAVIRRYSPLSPLRRRLIDPLHRTCLASLYRSVHLPAPNGDLVRAIFNRPISPRALGLDSFASRLARARA